jgi:Fe-S-cluster containining protein
MSKKKSKQQKIPKGLMKKIESEKVKSTFHPKDNTQKVTLKSQLTKIYNKENLQTICNGQKKCCEAACPSMFYSEFSSLINKVWEKETKEGKLNIICKSIEYFFKNEFEKFGMETLVKPCMLLGEKGCNYYDDRPLNCRLYGLWPEKVYNDRVDKFAKAYDGLVKKEDLPLNKQCPFVKRVDNLEPLTSENINALFFDLDKLDMKIGEFTSLQVENKENYRTFHDWLLLKIYGEEGLTNLTTFMMHAGKEAILDQIKCFNEAIRKQFGGNESIDGLFGDKL